MRWSWLCVLAALVLCVSASLASASDVVELTTNGFNANIAQGEWMVEFFAPWCGHCKKLAPIWEEFATKTKGKVNVAKVDATQNDELATAFEIRGYPTIKYIRDGQVRDYKGPRTVEAFEDFALKNGWEKNSATPLPNTNPADDEPVNAGASDVVVLTEDNFADTVSKGRWLVEFYAPWCGHCKKLAPTWEKLATEAKGKIGVAKVDATEESFLAAPYNIDGFPTIKYFPGDGNTYEYDGDRTVEAFVAFAKEGYKTAQATPVPSATRALFEKYAYKFLAFVEPLARLVMEYIGTAFVVLTLLGLVVGFAFGRLTAPQARVVFISKERYEELLRQRQESMSKGSANNNNNNNSNKNKKKNNNSNKKPSSSSSSSSPKVAPAGGDAAKQSPVGGTGKNAKKRNSRKEATAD